MIDTGLKNKVVCVTGGNNPGGIGAATAKAFAAEGAVVFVHYFRRPTDNPIESTAEPDEPGEAFYLRAQTLSADGLVKEIRDSGGRAHAWEADLGDAASVAPLFDAVEKVFGPVDVLVNNAAHCEPDTFIPGKSPEAGDRILGGLGPLVRALAAETHDRHFAVNSRAVALLMAEFARRHIARARRWGRIISVSTDGAAGFPSEVSYWASKHALESYSRAAACELGPYGITVNIVSPGPIQTGWMSPDLEAKVVPAIPLGRIGQPEDVADVIVFLASEQGRWLSGQLLYAGGGNRMHQ
jgi:3-oxoacyl-[acyl-carrier protein] reductase